MPSFSPASLAVNRCIERGIQESKVVETVLSGVCTRDKYDRFVYALGRMRVVMSGGGIVITAYRERKGNAKRNIRKARASRKKRKRMWA